MSRIRFPFLAVLMVLAGCVAQGPFPSLAPRPEELIDPSLEPVREDPAVTDDAALGERITSLLAQARRGWEEFEAERGPTERAIGRAGARGSESWVEAQQGLSRLEAARVQTTTALGELEQLAVARADLPTSPGDRAALREAIEEASAVAARQQEAIVRLRRD